MEAKGHDRKFLICALECFGTALFIFGILQTSLPISIPFSLMASIIIFGDIPGGHFNPAVTIGVFTSLGNYSANWFFCLLIIASQFAGGMLAIGINWLGSFGKPDSMTAALTPTNRVTGMPDNLLGVSGYTMDLQVCLNEVICTFLFVSVILMVKG